MNETAATIKQLSSELHISEQALRQWCKRNEIQKTTKGKVTSYFLSANDVELIRKHYTEQRKQTHNESTSKAQRKESEYLSLLAENEKLKAHITEQNNKIESLRRQLSDTEKKLDEYKHKVSALTEFNNLHHKTIDRLEKENNKLNERLDKAETERAGFLNNISELTIALKAAQALHGMDKQQAAIELKEPAEQATQDQSEPPRKTSLFSKLFRRTK